MKWYYLRSTRINHVPSLCPQVAAVAEQEKTSFTRRIVIIHRAPELLVTQQAASRVFLVWNTKIKVIQDLYNILYLISSHVVVLVYLCVVDGSSAARRRLQPLVFFSLSSSSSASRRRLQPLVVVFSHEMGTTSRVRHLTLENSLMESVKKSHSRKFLQTASRALRQGSRSVDKDH